MTKRLVAGRYAVGGAIVLAVAQGFSLLQAQSLEQALDGPGFTWTTSATDGFQNPAPGGEWVSQSGVTHDGVDAAKSGTLPLFGLAKLRTESITGPGTVTFWRRHGLTSAGNPFTVIANGSNVGPFLPGGVWQPFAIDFPPGPGTLEFWWSHFDVAGSEADNHAYVDEVAFVPTSGAPQFHADPPPDLVVGEGYTVQPALALRGEKPMQLELTLPGAGSPLLSQLEPSLAGMSPAFSGWSWGFGATPALEGVWTIKASNASGTETRSFSVSVVPTAPHSIFIDGPVMAWEGATVRLTAIPRGTAPFTSHQWKKDGSPITGATDPILELADFTSADEGSYTVVVGNALGSGESNPHPLSLGNEPPVLLSQSGDVDLGLFDSAYLEVRVSGTPPFQTEWRKDGAVLQEEAASSSGWGGLSLWADPSNTPGVYGFRSWNGLGEVVSDPIVVQVGEGVGIAEGLDNRNVGWRYDPSVPAGWALETGVTHDGTDAVGFQSPSSTPLQTAVEGPAAVSFWWRVVDGDVDFLVNGAAQQTLSAAGADSDWQPVTVALGTGWQQLEWQARLLSNLATPAAYLDEFVVQSGGGGPVIVTQPEGGDYFDGQQAMISVTVTGSGPFDYRLFKEGDAAAVAEASAEPSLSYSFNLPLAVGAAGAYWITITDAAGRSVASDDAVISVDGLYGSLANLAAAVGQPDLIWFYSDYSIADGAFHSIRPWYHTRQDGVAGGEAGSARTPVLNNGELAALVMQYDSGSAVPSRLRFWARVAGAQFEDVFTVSVNGVPQTLTPAETTAGASGETWTTFNVMLGGYDSEVQFEVFPPSSGVTAWLDLIEIVPAVAPVITEEPTSLTLPADEAGALAVIAVSPVPFTYQWFKVGTGELTGQTADTLTFAPATAADNGLYYVQVSSEFGATDSEVVTVTVTGPRPQITQPVQPQQLQPGEALNLEVGATSSNGPLTYRWFRDGGLVQTGGAVYQRSGVTTADHGWYRVEVSDPYYTVTSQAQVSVALFYYHLTVLPPPGSGGYLVASAINNAGVIAGYAGDADGTSAVVWENGVLKRMTPPGSPFSWGASINNGGDIVGVLPGEEWGAQRGVVRWSPPYTLGAYANLGRPTGGTVLDFGRINDAGVIIAMETTTGGFGQPRFAFRYTTAGSWEPLGPLAGATPLGGAVDRGWATALDLNNAGVIVGLTYFEEPNLTPTQATGWFFNPTAPGQRTAMDTLSSSLALTPAQPWGWIDNVNDLGDMVARRYGASAPTKLFLIQADGTVSLLLERPPRTSVPDGESFNVDALNNRREMVGYIAQEGFGQRAALVRSRNTPPGGTPATFNDFALYDLNGLVVGGTGEYVLNLAYDINDHGQIVGTMSRESDGLGYSFLLTPATPYMGMAALAVDDVIVRRAGQGVRFSSASLSRNDVGAAPLSVSSIAPTSTAGGAIADLGDGWYRYTPPPGPDGPDTFTYTVSAGDGSSNTGTVRVRVEEEPPPSGNQLPIQLLPSGEVQVRFVGIPGRTYQIEAAPTVNGPWTFLATRVAGPTGIIEYTETPPSGEARFYRARE
ncbi:MAG: cadherin-like domain-containing protein [Verrucomicrobiales bacterium]|nr:cadherin-like domain-containing protein [Verrucomicrobiales bacterium]